MPNNRFVGFVFFFFKSLLNSELVFFCGIVHYKTSLPYAAIKITTNTFHCEGGRFLCAMVYSSASSLPSSSENHPKSHSGFSR